MAGVLRAHGIDGLPAAIESFQAVVAGLQALQPPDSLAALRTEIERLRVELAARAEAIASAEASARHVTTAI